MSEEQIIMQIKKDLSSSEKGIRRAALNELGKLGSKGIAAIPDLIKALKDPDDDIRWTAAEAAGSMGYKDPSLMNELTKILTDPYPPVVVWARYALVKIEKKSDNHLKELIKATYQGERDEIISAIRALGQLGYLALDARPRFEELVKNESDVVRFYAQKAIDSLAEAEALVQEGSPTKPDIDTILSSLRTKIAVGSEREVTSIVSSMVEMGAAVIPSIENLMVEASGKLAEVLISVLAQIGVQAIPSLTKLAQTFDTNADILNMIARAINSMSAEATSELLNQLHSRDKELYDRAVIGLSMLRSSAAIYRMAVAMIDSDTQVGSGIARALIKIGTLTIDHVVKAREFFLREGLTKAVDHADFVLKEISKNVND